MGNSGADAGKARFSRSKPGACKVDAARQHRFKAGEAARPKLRIKRATKVMCLFKT
jgi:hypothetical protein